MSNTPWSNKIHPAWSLLSNPSCMRYLMQSGQYYTMLFDLKRYDRNLQRQYTTGKHLSSDFQKCGTQMGVAVPLCQTSGSSLWKGCGGYCSKIASRNQDVTSQDHGLSSHQLQMKLDHLLEAETNLALHTREVTVPEKE
ncbi:hypothetical protein Tco_0282322 [Tanacetum coccineum]